MRGNDYKLYCNKANTGKAANTTNTYTDDHETVRVDEQCKWVSMFWKGKTGGKYGCMREVGVTSMTIKDGADKGGLDGIEARRQRAGATASDTEDTEVEAWRVWDGPSRGDNTEALRAFLAEDT
jgi:hypothetical protein